MQKRNKKAFILIWSIILSLILSIAFISISSKLNKNIKLNNKLSSMIDEKNEIENGIKSNGGIIGDDEFLTEEKNSYIIDKDKSLTFTFSGTTDFTGDLFLTQGGPIFYNIKSYNGVNHTITSSGIITQNNKLSFSGFLNIIYNKVDLSVQNLGGLTQIEIDSNKDFYGTGVYKNYKVEEKIGGKKLEKTIITKYF